MEEERKLVLITKVGEELRTSLNCSPLELFGIIGALVEQLQKASQGQLEYNQILTDLKIIETTEGEK